MLGAAVWSGFEGGEERQGGNISWAWGRPDVRAGGAHGRSGEGAVVRVVVSVVISVVVVVVVVFISVVVVIVVSVVVFVVIRSSVTVIGCGDVRLADGTLKIAETP